MDSKTQCSTPRPTTQKNPRPRTDPLEAEAKDQGHKQKCSPKKSLQKFFSGEKVFKNFFSGGLHLRKTKKGLRKFFARFLAFLNKISTVQKIVLFSSRGQGNFRVLEASRPRTSKCVLEAKDVLEGSTSANKSVRRICFFASYGLLKQPH